MALYRVKPRILATAINEDDNTASLPLAMEVAEYFELEDGPAREIAKEVGNAVSKGLGSTAEFDCRAMDGEYAPDSSPFPTQCLLLP